MAAGPIRQTIGFRMMPARKRSIRGGGCGFGEAGAETLASQSRALSGNALQEPADR
jgi:hypothetical protein